MLGIGATSSLLALVMGGHVLSMLNIFLILAFCELLFSQGSAANRGFNIKSYHSRLFLTWMTLGMVSSIYGIFRFIEYDEFRAASVGSFFKIIIYILFLIFLGTNSNPSLRIRSLMGGIKFGIILNLIWCIADAAMYYTTNVSLTNTVFQSYIQATDMRHGMASLTDGFMIRSVGLNNDPATVGFFAIAASAYSFLSKKYIVLILSILASFACVSFTAIVGIVLVTLYYLFFNNSNLRNKISLVLTVAIISLFGFLYFTLSDSNIATGVRTALEMRATAKVDGAQSSEIREYYIKNFLSALNETPEALVIGTGCSTASFPYFSLGLKKYEEFRPFDMENTYIATFFDIGLIGLLAFTYFYFRIFILTRNLPDNIKFGDLGKIINATSISALISFMFYHYTLYSVLMFISIASLFIGPQKNMLKGKLLTQKKHFLKK